MARRRRRTQRDQKHLEACRAHLQIAREFRRAEGYDGADGLWRRMIDLYRGKHFNEAPQGEDRIAVNIAKATVDIIAPSVAVNYPTFTINAKEPDDEEVAQILQVAINHWWRHYEFLPEFQRAVRDMLILGFGWVKVGWEFEEKDVPLSEEDLEEEYGRAVDEVDSYAYENPHLAGELPTDDELRAGMPETKTLVLTDKPYIERLSPFDVFVDPEATSIADTRWIAQRITRSLAEVRADADYDKKARESVQADSRVREDWRPEVGVNKERLKRVTVWEFYDLHADTWCVFAESGEDYLVAPEPIPFPFGHPFVFIPNYIIPDYFYPMGELEAVEPLQHELNRTRSDLSNHRSKYKAKWLYRAAAFDAKGRQALESQQENVMVPVNGNIPFSDAVAPMPIEQVPPDLYNQSQMIVEDVRMVAAISEYQQGMLSEGRRSATEAAAVVDAANARAADKLAIVERALAEVASRLTQLAQEFLESDDVAQFTGRNGAKVWVAFNREEIQGEFYFEVEAGSTQPRNELYRRQTAQQMLTALGPLFGSGLLNERAILSHIMKWGFGFKDAEQFLAEAHDPAQGLGAPDPQAPTPIGQEGPNNPAEERDILVEAAMRDQQGLPVDPTLGGRYPQGAAPVPQEQVDADAAAQGEALAAELLASQG